MFIKGAVSNVWTISGNNVKLSGNINWLLGNPDIETLGAYAFSWLFAGNKCITDASELSLPAMTLANSCYLGMFSGCDSLTTAPELPATTLAELCYYAMFQDCASLTTAPELPATTLVNTCYANLFYNCSNIRYIKCLATDISAPSCTDHWVYGISGKIFDGTFVKARSMNSWPTTGANGIPYRWTVIDA